MVITKGDNMTRVLANFLLTAVACCFTLVQPVAGAETQRGQLINVQWLAGNLQRDKLLILDASPAPMHAARHIPGAVHVDVFSFGAQELPPAEVQRRFQAWGLSSDRQVIIYDQGGTYFATRLLFDLYYYGFPVANLAVLDGGMAKWLESGGVVTKEPTPLPAAGSFRVQRIKEEARVRLPEFLVASGEPGKFALVEALEPSYHFGEGKFFDRAGHVPNSIMLPSADFYNADKTFKSPDEIRRMVKYLGIRPDQQILSYCGGGVAASVPFFALKFIAGYPNVRLYKESQLEWLRDDRGLPLWTYSAPQIMRDMNWLNSWSNRMTRTFGVARISIVDVRPAEAYQQGHVPYALNVPAELFRSHLESPDKLAEALGANGVSSAEEAVIVSDGGVNARSALAFLQLERLGHKKVSILMGSVDEWGMRGLPLAKEPTVIGAKKSPQDLAVPAGVYRPDPRSGVMLRAAAGETAPYPTVYIASGRTPLGRSMEGKVIHLAYTELLDSDGTPKAAKDIWNLLAKAGVPRYAEIICVADDPGEAAANYYLLKLMGFPDVKVLVA